MSVERVQTYLDQIDSGLKVIEFGVDTSTCELAAQALGVEVGQIAKSMVYKSKDNFLMIVATGDVRIDSKLVKKLVGGKVRMATPEETLAATGWPVGGVCPFLLAKPIPVFIDTSIQKYDVVYSSAGTDRSALPITFDELLEFTGGSVCSVASSGG